PRRLTIQALLSVSSFFRYWYADPRDLRSFPTRRSSDLRVSEVLQIPWGRDEMIAPREMGQSGTDVRLVGEAAQRLPFAIECKAQDRKSTRLNSSHVKISYAVFCLKKKTQAGNRYCNLH